VSKYPYENAIEDMTHKLAVRERQFAVFDVPANPEKPAAVDASAVVAAAVHVEKLEDGFFSISGGVVDAAGKLYFVDRHQQRIYGWSAKEGLTVERDNVLDPVNLAIDKAGDLMVVSSDGPEGTVYSFHPGTSPEQLTVIAPTPIPERRGGTVALPVNYWNNGEFRNQLDFETMRYKTLAEMFAEDASTPKMREYVSPDGSLSLPAARVFQEGPPDSTGWRFSDNLDTYGLIEATPGRRVYVESSSEDRTYSATVNSDGTLTGLKVFAERGGESVAEDSAGNVYLANGQIFVYDASGRQIALIEVPERPLQILFGGADRHTLFILAHHALFAVKLRNAGM
jgi:sugar lactone lactonase YvrE